MSPGNASRQLANSDGAAKLNRMAAVVARPPGFRAPRIVANPATTFGGPDSPWQGFISTSNRCRNPNCCQSGYDVRWPRQSLAGLRFDIEQVPQPELLPIRLRRSVTSTVPGGDPFRHRTGAATRIVANQATTYGQFVLTIQGCSRLCYHHDLSVQYPAAGTARHDSV